MRHFINTIAFLLLGGCYTININLPPHPVTPGSDAGPMIGSDASPMAFGDAGPVPVADAGTDAPPPVTPTELSVTMAATPVASVAVRNQPLIPSVGLVFTASPFNDVHVSALRLTGRGETETSAFAAATLNDVVTFCGLYRDDSLVSEQLAPDATTGEMLFTGIDLTVSMGSSVIVEVRCTADTVVSRELGDRFAIGIVSAEHIVAENRFGGPAVTTIGMSLYNNTGSTPVNAVTVMPHGYVTYETDNLRQSTILVAGGDIWQNLAQYQVIAQLEPVDLDVVRITSRGDAASFTMVAVALEGAVLGTCILPAGTDRSCDVHLSSPIHVDRDANRTFQLWGKLANVVSSASVGGATSGVARSGAIISLGLAADTVTGDWDVNYTGSSNVRATGVVSGDRLYAANDTLLGNEFVVRRTKPTITRQTLSTTTIANGLDQDLYRFQVSADSAGSVAVMGFRFRMSIAGSGSVSSLRIRAGSSDVVDAVVTFSGPPSNYVTVVFADERTITGSGTVFTLHGVVNGFAVGDSISTALHRDLAGTITTGYVTPGLWLDTADGPLLTGILWSDMSEVPHSYATRTTGGSMDWTNDVYVEDLTQTQTLTR